MTDCPTGRTVTLPLVWRRNQFFVGSSAGGFLAQSPDGYEAWRDTPFILYLGTFPTRSAAERAVEDAVIAALGGNGDE